MVDRTTIVGSQELTRFCAERLQVGVFFVRLQVRCNKRVDVHLQMRSDPLDITGSQFDTHGLAAVRTACAVNDIERLLMKLCGKLVRLEPVIAKFEAVKKFVVLLVIACSVLAPIRD
jgi:hypothetical protein